MDNKKKIIVSVIGIIILLVMVVGVTYAMYTYTGTGSKENVITTGNISVSYAESKVVNLENTYPMSDALGIQGTESSEMKFTVTGNITGNVTINYAIGLDAIEEGETLKDEYVKIYMLKGNEVVSTFTEGVGTLISELEQNYVDGQLGSYALYTDSFTEEGITSQEYTIKAWVSEEYDLPGDDETKVGDTISKGTTSETFKFKIKVVATDQRLVIGNDNTGPTCGTIAGDSTTWTGDNRTITIGCSDASGCVQETYSKTFDTTTEIGTITITDNIGNTTDCPVNVYVDKTDYTVTLVDVEGGAITTTKETAKVGETITILNAPTSTSCDVYEYVNSLVKNTSNSNEYATLNESVNTFTMPRYNVTITPSWNQTQKILYNYGNLCTANSGGWGKDGSTSWVTFNTDNIYAYIPGNIIAGHYAVALTTNAIDLTDYNYVNVTLTFNKPTWASVMIVWIYGSSSSLSVGAEFSGYVATRTYSHNVSSFSTAYRIASGLGASGDGLTTTANIYKIWLSK